MANRSLRDLIQDLPRREEPEPTLRSIAQRVVTERTQVPDDFPGFSARMPGDEDPHPFGGGVENPMPSLSVLDMSRALREGAIPFEKEREVRAYLDQFQRRTGEVLYDPRNHQASDAEPQEPRVYGDATNLSSRR
jgi:hypothetical protein